MNLKIAGLLAGLALSDVALAQGTEQQAGQMGQQQGQMGQQPGQMGQQPGQQPGQLSGRVLGMSEKTVFIEGSDGAAIPVTVTHETSIDGQRLKKDQRIESHLKRQLQQGEEVRASFEVRKGRGGKMENVATSIEKGGGAGGAGMQRGGMGQQGGAQQGGMGQQGGSEQGGSPRQR